MAIVRLNPTDFDYSKLLETLNKAYKTQNDITLSNFDNDSAPQVQAGSIFANNGSLFENDADVTPTGYAGISNSTIFYLYYDADGTEVFIFSSTAPVWSDEKQDWYNGNNRAYFSMFKDSGGTLYQNKWLIGNERELYNRKLITGNNKYQENTTATFNTVFDRLAPFIPNTGNDMVVSGSGFVGVDFFTISSAERTSPTTIDLHRQLISGGIVGQTTITDGNVTAIKINIAW